MKRQHIYIREDQRDAMRTIAEKRKTTPPTEYREAINNHIEAHLPAPRPKRR